MSDRKTIIDVRGLDNITVDGVNIDVRNMDTITVNKKRNNSLFGNCFSDRNSSRGSGGGFGEALGDVCRLWIAVARAYDYDKDKKK